MLFEGAKCYRRDGVYLGVAQGVTAVDGYSFLIGTTRYTPEGKCIAGRFYDAVRAEGASGEVRALLVETDAPAVATPEPLALVPGGYYRRRDGEVIGPVALVARFTKWPFEYDDFSWTPRGEYSEWSHDDGTFPEHRFDLVAFLGMEPPAEAEAEAEPATEALALLTPEPAPAPDFAEVEEWATNAVAVAAESKIYNGTIGVWTPLGGVTVNGSFWFGTDGSASCNVFSAKFGKVELRESDLRRVAVHRRGAWVSLLDLVIAAAREWVGA